MSRMTLSCALSVGVSSVPCVRVSASLRERAYDVVLVGDDGVSGRSSDDPLGPVYGPVEFDVSRPDVEVVALRRLLVADGVMQVSGSSMWCSTFFGG